MEKIRDILKTKQPEEYKKLNIKKQRKEHLSFRDIDKMMRNNKGIDERKCR